MKKLLYIAGILIVLSAAILFLLLPQFIEKVLCNELSARLDSGNVRCRVSGFGFNHIHISEIVAGDDGHPFLKVDSLKINYTIRELFYGKIDSIDVSGLHIAIDLEKKNMSGQGSNGRNVCFPETFRKRSEESSLFQIGRCTVRNSELSLISGKNRIEIPLVIDLSSRDSTCEISCASVSPDALIDICGVIDFQKCKAAGYFRINNLNLQRLCSVVPKFKSVELSGLLDMTASLNYHGSDGTVPQISGNLQLKARNMDFNKKFKLGEAELSLHSPDIMSFKTFPRQTLSFKSFSCGKMSIESGKAVFQVDSIYDYFVESVMLSMWGGSISMETFPVNLGSNYKFTMSCENLNVGNMVKQLDIGEASGNVTLNGDIPVTMLRDRFEIDDTELSSLPGQEGTIELWKSKKPDESGKTGERKFNVKALLNFNYDKIKLVMKTSVNELTVSMNMHGKPLMQLNITYGKKWGEDSGDMNNKGLFAMDFSYSYKFPIDRINDKIRYVNEITGIP